MNVQAMFSFSELAFAAYATLIRGSTTAQQAALEAADVGMSPKQAEEFARLYPTVVTSFDDAPNTSFQVTVFKDTAGDLPGNLTIAFRGTTIPEDLSTGLDIVGFGTGYDQIVAMANWWLRASAKDQMVQQFRLTSYPADAVPVDAVVIRPNGDSVFVLEAAPEVAATGELVDALAADPDHRVDVTGHSLGGHLAMAFSSLFAAQTGAVTVFNAPGFTDSPVNEAFFAKLGGSIPTNAAGNIVNVAADEALVDSAPFNWIAGMNSRPGEQINIAIEKQTNSESRRLSGL